MKRFKEIGLMEQYGIRGLNEEEVAERISEGKVNRTGDQKTETLGTIILKNVFTFFNIIFFILAALVIAAGSFKNLTFMIVVILNTIIGIIQEYRAKKILDKLSVMDQSTVSVIRSGGEKTLSVDDLVKDDLIKIKSGTQIPADAVLVDGAVSVNESLLTGEADEIEKIPVGGDNDLRSGSFVVSGEGLARLTKVGGESYITQLSNRAKTMKKGKNSSEMVHAIDLFVKIAGILIIPIGITMFLQSYRIQGLSFSLSVSSMVAAVVGMIPEGLYLLLSIALAMSAARLALNHVVLHDMRSIETLAHVDTLCVDKTGTITTGEMDVTECISPDGSDIGEYKPILGAYLNAMPDQNVTMKALRKYFKKAGQLEVISKVPFSSKNKYSELTAKEVTYRLGAPEMILGSDISKYSNLIGKYADRGERVLVFARKDSGEEDKEKKDGENIFKPLMFIAIKDVIRPNARETFAFFQKEDVTIRVISGDNPRTVSRIANTAGIKDADRYVDCSALKDDAALEQAVNEKIVFGRVSPEQKMKIVKILKKQKHIVAMTGDGVNDILAMKEADCSIAMGNGSDAARQSSQVVLLDNDFGHMTNIVYEGRRDVNNISRSATLFIAKNLFSFFLALFSIWHVMQYPLQPNQISLISMFNIGLPAFLLAMEPNQNRPHRHFLRHVIFTAFPASVTEFFIIVGMVIFCNVFKIPDSDVSVAATFLLAIVGFMILGSISRPFNAFRIFVIALCVVGLIGFSFVLPSLFDIKLITYRCAMLFGLFAICAIPLFEYTSKLLHWIEKKLNREELRA